MLMNKEKVKSLKKSIRYFGDKFGTDRCIYQPKNELFVDILSYINELENENKRLLVENSGIKQLIVRLKNKAKKEFVSSQGELITITYDNISFMDINDICEEMKLFCKDGVGV